MVNCATANKMPAEGEIVMRTAKHAMRTRSSRYSFAVFSAAVVCQLGVAQEPAGPRLNVPEDVAVESDSQLLEPIEELTVTAPQALQSMRQQLVRAEDDVLAVFNSLNDDDDYDVTCRRERPLGSNIPVRVCRAQFVIDEQARAAQDFMRGFDYVSPTADIRFRNQILRDKMAALMEESPDLFQALMAYYELKTSYDAQREERFEDNFIAR